MSDTNQVLEPWNDETNMSIEDRRGTFLKVLCILSWIAIGLSLVTNFFSFLGGKEGVLENISQTEDSIAKIPGDGGFMKLVTEMSVEHMRLTLEHFNLFFVGNILAGLIGGLGVYMMWTLQKTGFYLYILYSLITIGIVMYMSGMTNASGEIVLSAAFIIMYGVNSKRMTA